MRRSTLELTLWTIGAIVLLGLAARAWGLVQRDLAFSLSHPAAFGRVRNYMVN